jgi:hypothetical protein
MFPTFIGAGIGLSAAILAAAANSVNGNTFGWGVTGVGLLILHVLVLWLVMPPLSKALCSWKSAE